MIETINFNILLDGRGRRARELFHHPSTGSRACDRWVILTRDDAGRTGVVMRSGVRSWAARVRRNPLAVAYEPRPGPSSPGRAHPKRTNPEEILAFGVTDATRERLSLGVGSAVLSSVYLTNLEMHVERSRRPLPEPLAHRRTIWRWAGRTTRPRPPSSFSTYSTRPRRVVRIACNSGGGGIENPQTK